MQDRILFLKCFENTRSKAFIDDIICVSTYNHWPLCSIRPRPTFQAIYLLVKFIRKCFGPCAQFFGEIFVEDRLQSDAIPDFLVSRSFIDESNYTSLANALVSISA